MSLPGETKFSCCISQGDSLSFLLNDQDILEYGQIWLADRQV